ncbi:ATP-binding protein [Streptomyces sp. NA04227]|uniref:ATP-binding protein n=1 Tax=Streptomyces sp. NA04227 TaxID=2742136 RepID=UPI001590539B|nr:ATP-binding protein [Streptomyces sp. NA04227]QKW08585.1 ATP-binding protein [Streptomyces sp. NA04227]
MPEAETVPTTPWEYSLYIPHDLRAVTICRRTLRLILTMHGLLPLAEKAELLATELISNSVRHTKGPAALRVRWSAGVLRIGAWDADPEPPLPLVLPHPPQPPDSAAELAKATDPNPTDQDHGRGLSLVHACADLWGWHPQATGKYVWCELGSSQPAPSVPISARP